MTILQPVLQPVLRPLLADPLAPGFGDGLSAAVKALFASGEKGVMFDFFNAANLYTDSARTTLVSASGDGIGSATDLSGNGKHASSAGSARPSWNSAGYATFDAFDDYLQTAAIDFSATSVITVVSSVRKSGDSSQGVVLQLPSGAQAWLSEPRSGGVVRPSMSCGSVERRGDNYAAPATSVLSAIWNALGATDADKLLLRRNGADTGTFNGSGATVSFTNAAMTLGANNGASSTLFLNGRIYRLLVIGRALTTTERNAAERWAAQPVGITIP